MSLKLELLEKVPNSLKNEPHFQALLDHIKHHNIEHKEHLADFLGKEINLVESWLEQNKSAAAKAVRDKTIHLEVLRKCSELTQNFLF